MKQFKNLHEAFYYHPFCPLCQEPIGIDYKEQIVNGSWDKPKVVTVFTIPGGDEISIDFYTNEVLSYKEFKSFSHNYTTGGTSITSHTGNYNIYTSGKLLFGVSASCSKCSGYSFTLQICVDWETNLAGGIFFNSESLSVEEGEILHEIKNVYATEKTEYDRFNKVEVDDGIVKMSGYSGRRNSTITFPLMPLDHKNPYNLLNRIKNLIVFS